MVWCDTCTHSTNNMNEIPRELLPIWEEYSKIYPKIIYCRKLNVIRVAGESPTQQVDVTTVNPETGEPICKEYQPSK